MQGSNEVTDHTLEKKCEENKRKKQLYNSRTVTLFKENQLKKRKINIY